MGNKNTDRTTGQRNERGFKTIHSCVIRPKKQLPFEMAPTGFSWAVNQTVGSPRVPALL